jgi:hypothetical protein
MTRDRNFATRYSFEAGAEIFELLTGVCWNARTSELSTVGCYLETYNPLPVGTEVQLELTYQEEIFSTLGIVAHSKSSMGMEILFKATSSEQEGILQKWLEQLSGIRTDPKVHPSAPQ